MRLRTLVILAMLASPLAFSAPALAAPASTEVQTSSSPLITGANVEQIVAVARKLGTAELQTGDNGDPFIQGQAGDKTYRVYFKKCTDHANCEDISFYLGFYNVKPTLEVINDWNSHKRYGQAYLDDVKDACIRLSLDLEVGVSEDYLNATFALWALIMDQYAQHVGYVPTAPSN